MYKIMLCGRAKCCPEVERVGDEIIITDDYANEIHMNEEQFEILKDKIINGEIW